MNSLHITDEPSSEMQGVPRPVSVEVRLIAPIGFPMVQAGDDLAALIAASLMQNGLVLGPGDVLVVAQKIVSKAEGRSVDLLGVKPSERAFELASATGKDPRLVEVILSESSRVVLAAPKLLVVEHRLGFVVANAGVDQSNVALPDGRELVLLLPADPDGSAERLRASLQSQCGVSVGIVINDSFGRPWRLGTVGVAIGTAGLASLVDQRGEPDLFGRTLAATIIGHADEIASAASLLMGQAAEARPIVLARGIDVHRPIRAASELIRPAAEDLFR